MTPGCGWAVTRGQSAGVFLFSNVLSSKNVEVSAVNSLERVRWHGGGLRRMWEWHAANRKKKKRDNKMILKKP